METAVKTQNKYQVSIDLLNDAVGKEIATSLQYMYFHTHFEDDRYRYLSVSYTHLTLPTICSV